LFPYYHSIYLENQKEKSHQAFQQFHHHSNIYVNFLEFFLSTLFGIIDAAI